jgi:hypothetical protein
MITNLLAIFTGYAAVTNVTYSTNLEAGIVYRRVVATQAIADYQEQYHIGNPAPYWTNNYLRDAEEASTNAWALFSLLPTHPAFQSNTIPTVDWQFDYYRNEIKRVTREEFWAAEFSRTNTNHALGSVVRGVNFHWQPEAGSRELGYRSDGTVLWRFTPEGK